MFSPPQSTCSFHFRSVHFSPFKPSMSIEIITCITKHWQQQRNRESNAINSQDIPQGQGGNGDQILYLVPLQRNREQRARDIFIYIVSQSKTRQRKPDHPKISCVEEAPRSIRPLCQDHQKAVALQQSWRGKEQAADSRLKDSTTSRNIGRAYANPSKESRGLRTCR